MSTSRLVLHSFFFTFGLCLVILGRRSDTRLARGVEAVGMGLIAASAIYLLIGALS